MSNSIFANDVYQTLDRASVRYDNLLVIGDLNYNMMNVKDSQPLADLCDLFDLNNKVMQPTCFTKTSDPTLIGVILTNKRNSCCNVLNFSTSISDCHNFFFSRFVCHTAY